MKKFLILLSLFLLMTMPIPSAAAQGDYYFAVENEIVHVYINADGTMSIDYTWVFVNQPNAHIIDYVDVGMPNYYFDMSTVSADVDGTPVSVSEGDYAGDGSGFAIVLGGRAIPAGQRGTVHAYIGRVERVLYPDTDNEAYASVNFAPTWFGSQYVTGNTELSVIFHLPPGVQPEEPRWHAAPSGFPSEPQAGFDNEGRITYTWYSANANAYTQYTFGASFPRSYVPAEAIYTPPAEPLIDLEALLPTLFVCCFIGLFFGLPILGVIKANRRRLKYLPPKISIEGHGIKRGLTAVEAAILMEQPLDKVMTMILFGVIKKGAAEVVKRDPLELAFANTPPEGLHQYEKDFLKAFREKNIGPRRKLLQDMTIALVRSVADKMKGFSRKETIEYYKAIMEKAWAQVEAANTPEVKSQKFDENLEWTMLDKDYDDRTRRVMTGPVFVPSWWGHYDPTYRPLSTSSRPIATSTGKQLTSAGGGAKALPGADFAASVVSGVQNFSTKVLGNVGMFTERVTGTTNPPPAATTSRYSGGSGGSSCACACACACAGCACACAGGGR